MAKSRGDPQLIGDLLEHIEQAENGTERGRFGKPRLIEIAAQSAPEGLDARRRLLGEIGEGAIFDFAPFAEGFPEEDGGGRVAVGDGGDVHTDGYSTQKPNVKLK